MTEFMTEGSYMDIIRCSRTLELVQASRIALSETFAVLLIEATSSEYFSSIMHHEAQINA